jgi:phosphatidate cytidylyltransferase
MELEQRPGRETPTSRGETGEGFPTADPPEFGPPEVDSPMADPPEPQPETSTSDRPESATADPATPDPATPDPATPAPPDDPKPERGRQDEAETKAKDEAKDEARDGAKDEDRDKAGGGARTRRGPGRNLPIAIGVGLALGAVVLLGVYLVKWVFVAIIAIFLGVAVRELSAALSGRGIRVPFVPVTAGGLAMLIVSYTSGPRGLLAAFSLTVLFVLVWRMPAGTRHYFQDAMAGVFAAAYVPFMGGFAVLLLASGDGADRVITFIAVTVSSDIGGFFAGAFLGRHQLAPSISPKKTWEGLAGSALTCMGIGALLLPLLLDGRVWQGVVLGAAVVCSATLGDLIESMIKRDLGIKDMGRLLPEHGGVMDRLDSLLITAPVVWLALQIFLSNG